jgi:predicted DsbA family dithiol-disulfide isomerase
MHVKLTYYLEVISSWCYWAEPAWAELKRRYAGQVEFDWKIALMDGSGMPASQHQEEWFFRRSGTIMRSPFMLNAGWFDPGAQEYLAPNCVAEAAKDLGITDDRVRLAIAEAALRQGQKVRQWDVSVAAAVNAAGLDAGTLLAKARSPEIEKRVRASTAEFHALQVTQRPTFLLRSFIDDRAVFSGVVRVEPIAATLDAMLADVAAYISWQAHMGDPPVR